MRAAPSGLTHAARRCGMGDEKQTAKAKQEHSDSDSDSECNTRQLRSPFANQSRTTNPESPPLWHPTCISTSHEP